MVKVCVKICRMCDGVSFWRRCILGFLFGGVIVYGMAPFVIQTGYVGVVGLLGSHSVVAVSHLVQVSVHPFHSF